MITKRLFEGKRITVGLLLTKSPTAFTFPTGRNQTNCSNHSCNRTFASGRNKLLAVGRNGPPVRNASVKFNKSKIEKGTNLTSDFARAITRTRSRKIYATQ
jgi:hypothetical protein